jgi:hypothetical protein
MMQLHLFQPKKIHSEQSNGLLRVLSVGPPRENIMGRFSVPTLWRMRAVCRSCRAWGCEALTALPRPIVIAGVTFPGSRCPATGALFALLLLSVWCAPLSDLMLLSECCADSVSTVEVLDWATLKWFGSGLGILQPPTGIESVPNAIVPPKFPERSDGRSGHQAVVVKNNILVIGGVSNALQLYVWNGRGMRGGCIVLRQGRARSSTTCLGIDSWLGDRTTFMKDETATFSGLSACG